MAIEPLNSVMSFNAQTIKPTQDIKVDKPAVEYTESNAQETYQVDNKTVVVDAATQKDGESGQSYSGQPQEQPNLERIKKAVEDLNKKMANSEALFGIHEETQRVTIKIVDKQTKEVIKELPPEKTLDMIAKVWEMAGLMVDERR